MTPSIAARPPLLLAAIALAIGAACNDDAATPSVGDGACGACEPGSVRLIAPLSTARTTTRRPRLRYASADGSARIDLCADRPCSTVIETIAGSGGSARPSRDLPPGTVFWRAKLGGLTTSTWQLRVPARSGSRDASWGATPDIDSDGDADLVIGANMATGSDAGGRVYVYETSSGGVRRTSPTTALSGTMERDGLFGYSLALGDFDGDGDVDLAVGAFGESLVYVFSGGPDGISATPAQTLTGAVEGCFGDIVVGPGDVDGDGYADLAVSDRCADAGLGRVYVFVGSSGGLVGRAATVFYGHATQESGSGALGQVRAAGDVDADGFADLLVGDSLDLSLHRGGPDGIETESAWSVRRSESASVAYDEVVGGIDLDGDGRPDTVVATEGPWDPVTGPRRDIRIYAGTDTGPSTTPTWSLDQRDECSAAPVPTRAVGDFDSDGFDDLVLWPCNGLWVLRGSPAGPSRAPSPTIPPPPPQPHAGYSTAEEFGASASALDYDGDGYDDLVVGAPSGADYYGRVFVYRGSALGLGVEPDVSLDAPEGSRSLFGSAFAQW